MAYEPQNFKDGQVLTAEQLNKMEAWMSMAQPPYIETGVLDVFPEVTLSAPVDSNETRNIFFHATEFEIAVGNEYEVTINGTNYNTIASEFYGVGFIGNGALLGMPADDTGESFCVASTTGQGTSIAVKDLTTITVKVSSNATVVHPLEPMFIPDNDLLSIANEANAFQKDVVTEITFTDDETSLLLQTMPEALRKGTIKLNALCSLEECGIYVGTFSGRVPINATVFYGQEYYIITALLGYKHILHLEINSNCTYARGTIKELSFA